MKRLTAIILTLILFSSCLIMTANAKIALSDKISEELQERIEDNADGGLVTKITYDCSGFENWILANSALCQKIDEITYCEIGTFSKGVIYVGLPYASINAVAGIDEVESITIPDEDVPCTLPADNKLSDQLKEKLASASDDEEIPLTLWLSYGEYIYYGFNDEGLETAEEIEEYREKRLAINREYHQRKNQEYADRISERVAVTINDISHLTPIIKDVMALASLSEISQVVYTGDEVTDNPTEAPTAPPTETDEHPEGWRELSKESFFAWAKENVPNFDRWFYQDAPDLPHWYQELYYHKTGEGDERKTDWVLIFSDSTVKPPWEMVFGVLYGKRVLTTGIGANSKNDLPYFIYDAEKGNYRSVIDLGYETYEGLEDAFEELHIGRLMGDVDNDGNITVIDATRIQKDLASIKPIENDRIEIVVTELSDYRLDVTLTVDQKWITTRYSDFDLDGETTVVDATHIQRYLASLE